MFSEKSNESTFLYKTVLVPPALHVPWTSDHNKAEQGAWHQREREREKIIFILHRRDIIFFITLRKQVCHLWGLVLILSHYSQDSHHWCLGLVNWYTHWQQRNEIIVKDMLLGLMLALGYQSGAPFMVQEMYIVWQYDMSAVSQSQCSRATP